MSKKHLIVLVLSLKACLAFSSENVTGADCINKINSLSGRSSSTTYQINGISRYRPGDIHYQLVDLKAVSDEAGNSAMGFKFENFNVEVRAAGADFTCSQESNRLNVQVTNADITAPHLDYSQGNVTGTSNDVVSAGSFKMSIDIAETSAAASK